MAAKKRSNPSQMLVPPCKQIAYLELDSLDPVQLRSKLRGAICFHSTRYLVVKSGAAAAIFKVLRSRLSANLARIRDLIQICDPQNTQLIQDPELDVTELSAFHREGSGALVVMGRYGYVRFGINLACRSIQVIDLVPPESRLYEMAIRACSMLGLNLRLELAQISIPELCSRAKYPLILVPCSLPINLPGKHIQFLDKAPQLVDPASVSLIGCTRSLEIFQELYGSNPGEHIQFCPLELPKSPMFLTRCCKLSSLKRFRDGVALPWGFSGNQLIAALRYLNRIHPG